MKSLSVSKVIGGVILGFVVAGSAPGAVLVHNFAVGPLVAGSNGTFDVPQFNAALGTLTSVSLVVNANSAGGSNIFDNENTNGGTADIFLGADVTVSGPGATLTVMPAPQQMLDDVVIAIDDDALPDFAGADSAGIVGGNGSDSDSGSLNDPPNDLSAYIGLGNVTFDYSSASNFQVITTLSGQSQFVNPNFDFDGTLTYTYTVPEPTRALLLIAGGVGMMMVRRRS
ncbi:MAG: PEP-CTERM sorting domain-containing protein [Verrucomicrobiota bacterium]